MAHLDDFDSIVPACAERFNCRTWSTCQGMGEVGKLPTAGR